MYIRDDIYSIEKAREKKNKVSSVKWEHGLESHTRRQSEGEGEVGMADVSSLL